MIIVIVVVIITFKKGTLMTYLSSQHIRGFVLIKLNPDHLVLFYSQFTQLHVRQRVLLYC